MEYEENSPTASLAAELRRCCEQLRQLPLQQLDGPLADAAHRGAQVLADLCAEVDGLPHRRVPRLAASASADQVAVLGGELVAALRRTWVAEVDRRGRETLVQLRRRLSGG